MRHPSRRVRGRGPPAAVGIDGNRRRLLDSGHRTDEQIPATRNRGNERLTALFLAQDLSEHENRLCQVGFFYRRVRPESLKELLFLDHAAGVPNQQEKNVEGFRRNREPLALSREQAGTCLQEMAAKCVTLFRCNRLMPG